MDVLFYSEKKVPISRGIMCQKHEKNNEYLGNIG